jgi:hypothetical protein
MAPVDRSALPCWSCSREPQASETRHLLANASDEDVEKQRTPMGRPLMCCKVTSTSIAANYETARGAGR